MSVLPLCISAHQSTCALLQMLLIQSTPPESQHNLYSGMGPSTTELALFQACLNLSSVTFFLNLPLCAVAQDSAWLP